MPPTPASGSSATPPQVLVLVFLRSLATPIVLYAENPPQLYEELKATIASAKASAPRLIEKPGLGPLKKVCFLDTELAGVALQSDPSGGSAASGGHNLLPVYPQPR